MIYHWVVDFYINSLIQKNKKSTFNSYLIYIFIIVKKIKS